jgi:type IV pilus assembly protein PilE
MQQWRIAYLNNSSIRLKHQGFSLIELMIVVAIAGILAAIAYPSYQENIASSRRADAQANLFELAQFMERTYTVNSSYPVVTSDAESQAALPFTESPKDGGNKYYDLTLRSTASTYTLTANPKGGMAGDACGGFTITNTGARDVTASATRDRDQCWKN